MIRYATLHWMGSRSAVNSWRYILKYFDPVNPTDPSVCEYVGFRNEPEIPEDTCLVKAEHGPLYEWVCREATSDMRAAVNETFWGGNLWAFTDMWSEIIGPDTPQVCGEPFDARLALLFLFWNIQGLGFNRRVFNECMPSRLQRRGA